MPYDWVIQPSNRRIDLIEAIKLILDFSKDLILGFKESEVEDVV